MDQKNSIRKITLATNWYCGILAVLCVILTSFSVFGVKMLVDFAGQEAANMTAVNPESITAGYEVIAHLFGSFGSIMFSAMMLGFAFICGIGAVVYVIPTIVGIVSCRQYHKNPDIMYFKKDAIVKMIFEAIPLALLIFAIVDSFHFSLLGIFVFACGMFFLSFKQFMWIRDINL